MQFLREFSSDRRGSILPLVAVSLTLIVGVVVAVTNISMASSQKQGAQDALDAAALAGVKLLDANATDAEIRAQAAKLLTAAANDDPTLPLSTVTIDRTAKTVSIDYASTGKLATATPLWGGKTNVFAHSKAGLSGSTTYPVCILITEPYDNHTLRTSNGSKADLNNCIVQVNTANWDAVEAKDTSYIHINGGQNCYVGDIHFGDVTPEKAPTCNLLADPFTNLSGGIPANCDYTNLKVDSGHPHPAPFTPGVYCGGLTIQQSVTFSPGVYYIKNGDLATSGNGVNITGNGVVFVFCGSNAGATIKSTGQINLTPVVGGKYDGFVFFLDQSAATSPMSTSEITGADVNMSGVVYLNGQHLVIGSNADVVITNGTMVAGYLLPQGGDINFTGALASYSSAAAKMQKAVAGSSPVLLD